MNEKPGSTDSPIVLEVAMTLLRSLRRGDGLPKRVGVLVAGTVLTLVLGATAALATTPSSTTGKGAYSSVGVTVNIQVSAYQYPDGSLKGQQQYTSSSVSWHGATPTCYALISPTESVFSGPITSSTDPSLIGQFYVIEVIDSAGKGVADQVGVDIVKKQPNSCAFHGTLNSITGGSLTVH
jgi:hypothetical protein